MSTRLSKVVCVLVVCVSLAWICVIGNTSHYISSDRECNVWVLSNNVIINGCHIDWDSIYIHDGVTHYYFGDNELVRYDNQIIIMDSLITVCNLVK